ncbi:lamin tail domain-containing protein [Larkinella insperata]|uniref:Lamin tail domain-containing protein n=1 Tax=Larkinella insperata TaxID=332158 RepID=A0ABW3QLY0_9BACT
MKNKFYLILCFIALSQSAFSQKVSFSANRGFYESPFQLVLNTDLAGATIRYTIDGSVPTSTTGTIYDQSIPITTTRVIRAIAYTGTATTPVVTHSYLFLNDVLTQPATIEGWPNRKYALGSGTATATHDYEMDPKVVNDPAYNGLIKSGLTAIPTLSLVLNKDEFWDLYEGETKHPTSVEIFYPNGAQEQFNCDLEAHSHNRLKRSLKLSFNTLTVSNLLKQAPFNSASTTNKFKDTKIVLRAGNNRSWAHNWNPDRTCYTRDEWYRASQQAVSGTGGRGTFVHLYVNGLYWGLYNPVERTDNGMLSTYFGGDFSDWMSLDHDGVHNGDASRFTYLTTTLINQDLSVAANYTQLKQYLDVSKFCDYLIVSWMMGMTDWPGNNFHGGNRNNPPTPFFYNAWDAEWSFDVTNGSNQGAWVHPEFRNTTSGSATIARIWHAARRNPEFMQLFADRVYKHCFNNGALTDAASRARWAQINAFINTAIIAESARWGDALQDGVTRTRDSHWTPEINRVDGLMNGNVTRFINALVGQGYYPTLTAPTFNQEGGTVSAGFQLVMTNPNASGTVYYTTDGSDPKATDGSVAPGATDYKGPVTLTANQTVKARIQNGTTWSALHEVAFTVEGFITGLFINEFMASNTKKPDENGEFDDWIEIYNSNAQPIDIGGLYITDALNNLTQWRIPTTNPALTTIPAKGYLLLWADGQPAQGPLHVNIKLSKGGEAIGLSQLVGSTPTLIDSYTFGAQKDDVSMGRLPDGASTFKEFFVPTPGSKNVIPFRANLLINEFLAVNQSSITDEAGEHDGWIEVYNNNTEAVDIGGMYLSNTYSNPTLSKIPATNPAQTTIPAKGFLTLWADGQPAQGVLHLGFTLNNSGGQLALTDIIGPDVSFSDSVSYGAQTANVSRGRFPDAAKQGRFFASPTPGAANLLPPLSNLYINEFMASNSKTPDEFGEFDDWIEIYNGGTEAVDLGGLYVTDDLTNPAKFQIPTTNPAQTTVPPKGFLLLWADDQATQGVRHVGLKLSAGGEQIGLYQPNGTGVILLDSYTFGAQTTDVSSGRQQDGGPNFVTFTSPTPGVSNVNQPPIANAGADQTIVLPTSSVVLSGNSSTDPDGTIVSYRWTQQNGPSQASLTGAETQSLTASGLGAGSYVFRLTVTDNRSATAFDDVAVLVNPAPAPDQTVVSFSLMNADSDQELKVLTAGDVINLATLPTKNLNIRANTAPATVGSVKLVLSGKQSRTQTETGAPYALFGDTNGDYKPWVPALGSYSLTATPYTGANAGGTAGPSLILNFTVINQAPPANRPPVVTKALVDQSATVGSSFFYSFDGSSFTDADGDVLTFAAVLEDNSVLPGWLSFQADLRSFSGTPPAGSPASLTVKVTASDGRGGQVSDSFEITIITPVTNTAPVLSAIGSKTVTFGQALSFTAHATDNDVPTQMLTYSVMGPASASIDALTGVFNWTPTVTGTYSLTVKVTDNGSPALSAQEAITVSVTPAPVSQPTVVSFSLMNADSDQELKVLTAGEVINLATLPTKNLNIRANTAPATVGSVKLVLSGKQNRTQTETGAPYALFGDTNGDYKPWVPALGSYSLTATPYTGANAGGTAGASLTLNFAVINQAQSARLNLEDYGEGQKPLVRVYPNPFVESFTMELSGNVKGLMPVALYDVTGRQVWQQLIAEPKQVIQPGSGLRPGVYLLQVGEGPNVQRRTLLKIP